ncbi:DUF4298 domain-containing protein [Bergeriella denitrificans]|nr:DUF4298 domain-containing protein [Bergeriella denitrificans]
MQNRINHIQSRYREWCALLPELEADLARWQQAAELINELDGFYTGGEYLALHEALENGASLDLTTPGEHSIMSQDALWTAYTDFQRIAWQRLRLATEALDPQTD